MLFLGIKPKLFMILHSCWKSIMVGWWFKKMCSMVWSGNYKFKFKICIFKYL